MFKAKFFMMIILEKKILERGLPLSIKMNNMN